MLYYTLSLVFGFLIFIHLSTADFQESPTLSFQGFLNTLDKGATVPSNLKADSVFNGLYISRAADGRRASVYLSNGHTHELKDNERAFVPFLGQGYFVYQKIGSGLLYYSQTGELLWNRKLALYPVGDIFGELVVLLAGDNNHVQIIDKNGIERGAKTISGNFLSDYDFSGRATSAGLVFSGGPFYLLDSEGKIVLRYRPGKGIKNIFLKSNALSPLGGRAAVHYYADGRDLITLLEKESGNDAIQIRFEIVLDKIYPHILHMAPGRRGLLVAAPDFTALYDDDGERVFHERISSDKKPIYRPVYSDLDFYVYGQEDQAVILDERGRKILSFPTAASTHPWRILPLRAANHFALHSGSTLLLFDYSSF